jgi:adenine-specific DNA-methyltransferase
MGNPQQWKKITPKSLNYTISAELLPKFLTNHCNVEQEINDPALLDYLQKGKQLDLPNRPLIQQRRPWYKMEKREIPPLLFAYLGRRDIRFILNEADVLPLTAFLCVYPYRKDKDGIMGLWKALNHPDTLKNLKNVGKSYGTEAIKVEPNNLKNLPIPAHIVERFNLCTDNAKSQKQYSLF